MKVVVDKMPATPRECSFAVRNVEVGYVCQLPSIIPDGNRCRTVCRDTSKCEHLLPCTIFGGENG